MGVPLKIHVTDASGMCVGVHEGHVLSKGATTPANGVPSYAPGSFFINTTNKSVYRNNGTKASCSFLPMAGATITADTINEVTANAGVTVDGTLLKDGVISHSDLTLNST